MALSLIVYASIQIIIRFHNTIENVVMFMTSYNVRSLLLRPAAAYSQHHVLNQRVVRPLQINITY